MLHCPIGGKGLLGVAVDIVATLSAAGQALAVAVAQVAGLLSVAFPAGLVAVGTDIKGTGALAIAALAFFAPGGNSVVTVAALI